MRSAAPTVGGPILVTAAKVTGNLIDWLLNAHHSDGDVLSVVVPDTRTDGFAFDVTSGRFPFDASGNACQQGAKGGALALTQTLVVLRRSESRPGRIRPPQSTWPR